MVRLKMAIGRLTSGLVTVRQHNGKCATMPVVPEEWRFRQSVVVHPDLPFRSDWHILALDIVKDKLDYVGASPLFASKIIFD